MTTRRHPLMDEVKSELDVMYSEIRIAEKMAIDDGRTMPGDGRPGELRKSVQATIEQLRILGQCYEHVLASADGGEAGQRILDGLSRQGNGHDTGLDSLSTGFGAALYAYSREDSGSRNDNAVRDYWRGIEQRLRGPGRSL